MLVERSRVLKDLLQFSRVLRCRLIGTSNFFSTSASEKSEVAEVTEMPEGRGGRIAMKLKELTEGQSSKLNFHNYRFKYPEFLPNPNVKYRNYIKEKLERKDMLKRRNVLKIPEFYVGSVLSVTTSDKHASGKKTRFVGICIMKNNAGLSSTFLLRNVIEHQGVEILYSTYSPVILNIDVLRLEKRLDDPLYYLRDAPNEYSTFPFDMLQEYHDEGQPVPVNTLKVPLNPRPWLQRYERMDLKGAILPEIPEKLIKQAKERAKPWEKYDLMDEYRRVIPEEDQKSIFSEINDELQELESQHKSERRKKVFVKPEKQKLF